MGFALVSLFRKTTPFKNPGRIVALSILAGFGLLLSDRITEFNIPNFGTIKAATQQATVDAETITKLKERVENQSATVDLIASQASKAQRLAEIADTQTKKADQNWIRLMVSLRLRTLPSENYEKKRSLWGL
jgi:hypothetical protein